MIEYIHMCIPHKDHTLKKKKKSIEILVIKGLKRHDDSLSMQSTCDHHQDISRQRSSGDQKIIATYHNQKPLCVRKQESPNHANTYKSCT